LEASAIASIGSGVPENPGTGTVTNSAQVTICPRQKSPARSGSRRSFGRETSAHARRPPIAAAAMKA
jgi:hypothetical protein